MNELLEELRTHGEVLYAGFIFKDHEKLRMVLIYSAPDGRFDPANYVGSLFFERTQWWYKENDVMIHIGSSKTDSIINWVNKRK